MSIQNDMPPPYIETVNDQINSRAMNNSHYIASRNSPYNISPIEMDCPHCQNHIISHIEKIAGPLPWLMCVACALIGFLMIVIPWFFCCVPFFVDHFLDFVHTCPACKRFLGRYNRM